MRLLWITNIPSPYRVDFFNELGQACDLTVLFERAGASDRDSSWLNYRFGHFRGLFMRGISYSTDSALCPEVVSHLKRGLNDEVVVSNFSSLTGALAIAHLKATRQRYYLESDGGFPSASRLKTWVKRLVIGGAKGYFSTSDVHDDYYLAYGAVQDRLIRYPFTSVRAGEILAAPPTNAHKSAARRRIGIPQKKIVLSVGQFIHRKGFDLLLKACSSLPDDTAVCFVGGEPDHYYKQLVREAGGATVHFVGFKSRGELSDYYAAADLFVLPTREDIWGLVINEALAHALPVLTTDRCLAGLELVEKNGCGRVVPAGDAGVLGDAINRILADDFTLSVMQNKALDVARRYTIELMARRHMDIMLGREGR